MQKVIERVTKMIAEYNPSRAQPQALRSFG